MQGKKNVSIKMLVFLFAAVLLVGCTIGATFAWLVSETEPVKNTFTVGNIQITLKEHVLDAEGKQVSSEEFTDKGLEKIKMVPGRVIAKDPTVTILKGSEDCYVRALIKITWKEEADTVFDKQEYNQWFDFPENWEVTPKFDGSFAKNGQYVGQDIYELRYTAGDGIVSASDRDVELPVFTKITVPEELDNEAIAALEGCGVEIIAQAIQAEGFEDAEEAWEEANFPMEIPEVPENPKKRN